MPQLIQCTPQAPLDIHPATPNTVVCAHIALIKFSLQNLSIRPSIQGYIHIHVIYNWTLSLFAACMRPSQERDNPHAPWVALLARWISTISVLFLTLTLALKETFHMHVPWPGVTKKSPRVAQRSWQIFKASTVPLSVHEDRFCWFLLTNQERIFDSRVQGDFVKGSVTSKDTFLHKDLHLFLKWLARFSSQQSVVVVI